MIGGHGYLTPRPDGSKARCGGDGLCPDCSREAALHGPYSAAAAPSPVGGADATPTLPPRYVTNPGDQTGPGWIMTTYGPVRRARPPWDIPAGPDSPGGHDEPPGTVEALDAQIRRAEVMLDGLRRLRDRIAASARR